MNMRGASGGLVVLVRSRPRDRAMDAADKANLKLRILSAAVLIPVAVAAIYFGGWFYVALVLVFGGGALYEWIGLARKTDISKGLIGFGVVYVTLSALMIWSFSLINVGFALFFFACVWASDTGAYAFGKVIGGVKILPSVSPNKTWAGLAGACVLPLVIIFGYGLLGDQFFDFSSVGAAIGLAVTIGISCQLGDFLVSKLKRMAGVKDTGRLIPGHGGVLDRIDSLLMAAIFVFSYLAFVVGALI